MLTSTDKTCKTYIKEGDWNMIRVAQYNSRKKTKYRIRLALIASVLPLLIWLTYTAIHEIVSRY